MTADTERWVRLDGCLNFRDIGGYRTRDGRTVARRRVYRSDSLHRLTEADAGLVAGELGLVTAIDLRAHDEVERAGRGPLADHGVAWVHAVTSDRAMSVPAEGMRQDLRRRPVAELYMVMLEMGSAAYGRGLEVLAARERHPAVLFCMAGKDRSGILSALVLALLGVPDEDIAADYALTGTVAPSMRERSHEEFPDSKAVTDLLPPDILNAPAHAMAETLVLVRDRFGSVEGFAEHAGAGPDVGARLRDALLE